MPLATVGALALVRPATEPTGANPPRATPLSRMTVLCPPALAGTSAALTASSTGSVGQGEVLVDDAPVRVAPGAVTTLPRAARVIVAADDLAPGLSALRSGRGRAADCTPNRSDQWFVGVGAGAERSSVVELVNPDKGAAVADLTVLSADGPLEVPALTGVRVPGRKTVRLDLGALVPRREDLSLHAVVSRGRLGVSVLDSIDHIGGGVRSAEWIPGQVAPGTATWLLGLPPGRGRRVVDVANPGDSEVRVSLKVVTDQSSFVPRGVQEISVAPLSTVSVNVSRLLGKKSARDATGLLLESDSPVAGTLRSVVAGDLAFTTPGGTVSARASLVLPAGARTLLFGGAGKVGTATVRPRTAAGKALKPMKVELAADRSAHLDLPKSAASVLVTLRGTTAVISLLAVRPGAVVVPLGELVTTGFVPAVRPALR